MTYPTYRQWQAFKALLPLPHTLLCLACGIRMDWRSYDVARRGRRDGMDHEQAAKVRVGAVCKVRQYEWYIPADGTSDDLVESFKDMVIPFHVSGVGCPDCQVVQSQLDSQAMRDTEVRVKDARRTVIAVPFAFDPKTHLRLPTVLSTRTTYIRGLRRHTPAKRIAYIDVTDRIIETNRVRESENAHVHHA